MKFLNNPETINSDSLTSKKSDSLISFFDNISDIQKKCSSLDIFFTNIENQKKDNELIGPFKSLYLLFKEELESGLKIRKAFHNQKQDYKNLQDNVYNYINNINFINNKEFKELEEIYLYQKREIFILKEKKEEFQIKETEILSQLEMKQYYNDKLNKKFNYFKKK